MPFHFRPTPDAIPQFPWNITLLSQRDVELAIPIPFVVSPGVSLTAACFPGGRYEDYSTAECISNLLAVGFRRLVVDLYWDSQRHIWSFCPVEVPFGDTRAGEEDLNPGPTSASRAHEAPQRTRSATGPSTSLSTTPASPTNPAETDGINALAHLGRRLSLSTASSGLTGTATAVRTSSTVSKTTLTVEMSTSSSSTFAVIPSHTASNAEETLYSIGPYICSSTSALAILNPVLRQFLDRTDNTVNASLRYVILNIHAASSSVAPKKPAQEVAADDLPRPRLFLGPSLRRVFSDFLLTPAILRENRNDLNDSWYMSTAQYKPNIAYYSRRLVNGVAVTSDGWPSESVMEFQNDIHQRLLLGFGTIDPQMHRYNRSEDNNVIFSENYMQDTTDSCAFDSNKHTLSAVNNSWSVTVADVTARDLRKSNYESPVTSIASLVRCGASPLLNHSLSSASANEDILPYKEFAYSAIWSWAWGEPKVRNDTDSFRCAVFDPASHGRWRVQDCSGPFRAACRVRNQPFQWVLSDDRDEYSDAIGLCPDNTDFDVPRTALENRYLLQAFSKKADHKGDDDNPLVWINLNSLDVETCWVTGRNATCPYTRRTSNAEQVYVPTVAGLIIVIVAGLLVLLKCGANRRNSRRRRRMLDGWDYEGVPS